MKQTIYIAGKVTGLPAEPTAAKFWEMQQQIEAKGHIAVNPITLVNNPDASWDDAMRICLEALSQCDGVIFLPCAVDSPGAQVELETAISLNLDLYADIVEIN